MRLSRSCWNDTTSALLPEKITSNGQEFHVCTINKSSHTKKKSGNLSYAYRIINNSINHKSFIYTWLNDQKMYSKQSNLE